MEALRRRANGSSTMGFGDFMKVALYDPIAGYYTKDTKRIGHGAGTDFATATTSGPLFGKLVSAACVQLLGHADPGQYDFIEIGGERGAGILDGVDHPFHSARVVGVGKVASLEGRSIVFSNELFDAQPFRRFRKGAGGWKELGVSLSGEGLGEVELEVASPAPPFPDDAPLGYTIDAPLAASALARSIASQPWSGLFLAFDYGKSWEELAYATHPGTARAYRRHIQNNDLLAFPGEQDLTCHICWDWIGEAIASAGFREPKVESQEAFFMRHAAGFMEGLMDSEGARMSRDKLSLMQLLHPAHMGQKFQAIWALRDAPVSTS
jgi:SAM-dependent MidA family methyltransferase